VGYQYDSDRPSPYWYFLGKTAAQALYGDPTALALYNTVEVGDREYIAFTRKAPTDVNVIEVSVKKPQPGKPLELFYKPANPIITQSIRRCR
jgi:hypothetical protein